jgi:serine/threonine protein phosphatase 1
MRTLAIGDIHGCSSALDALLAAMAPAPEDMLIFLGDYVDRGPDTRGVLDRLIQLKSRGPLVTLRGNHELMMLRSRSDRMEYRMWCSVGGLQALGSYGSGLGRAGTLENVPPEHWEFLSNSCVDYHETDTHIFVHASLNPDLPLNDQPEEALFWDFLNEPIRHPSGKIIVCGHTSQRSGNILDLGSTICIDTYVYGGQWLTGLDVHARTYWQANLMGDVRTGVLPAQAS